MRVEKDRKKPERSTMRAHSMAILGGLVFILGLMVWVWYSAYVLHSYGSFMRTTLKVVPLPAAYVVDEVVWMRDLAELAWLAETSGLSDPYDRAYETSIRRAYIRGLADEVGVSVDDEELDSFVDEVDVEMLESLGWSKRDYQRYLAKPLILEQTLEDSLYNLTEYQDGAYDDILALQSQYEDIGIAFPDLALQYSQGASADVSGWLGYLEEDELPAGYNAVWDLDVGDTVIIELEREFALVRVYDVTFLEVNRLSVAIQEILVNKQPLSEILDDYIGENSLFIRLVR